MKPQRRSLPTHPLAAGPIVIRAGAATAFLPDRVVNVSVRAMPLARLLELCDGVTGYASIRAQLARRVPPAKLDRFVASLQRGGLLIDAGEATRAAWRYVENPPRVGAEVKPDVAAQLPREAALRARRRAGWRYRHAPRFGLRALLEKRHSAYAFADRPVPARKILALAWAANGCVPRDLRHPRHRPPAPRTAPSAGAIYPLTVGLINFRAVPGLARGLYLVHFSADGAVGLRRVAADPSQAPRAFVDPAPLHRAQGALVVFGDFTLNAAKYRNRSVLLVTLEAGHAVQSAMLAAAELNIANAEICGFFEARLRALFRLGARLTPLASLVFGAPARAAAVPAQSARFGFEWLEFEPRRYQPAFHVAAVETEMGDGERFTCWGRAADPLLAEQKAKAEAIERLACALPRELYRASVAKAAAALDPRSVIAYHASQYRSAEFPFRPLSATRRYFWKDGVDLLTGKRRAVLAELVYFLHRLPAAARAGPYTTANTSGVAAYPTWEGALERAALEVLERDAYMRAWLLGETGRSLRGMPASVAARIKRLSVAGVRIEAKILRDDPAFVFMVFAQHRERAFTKVTAGADFDAEEALDHALTEAEAQIAAQLANAPAGTIDPRSVRTPADHARLYAQARFFRRADSLARGLREARMPRQRPGSARGVRSLARWLRQERRTLVWLDLSIPDLDESRGMHVLRALIPGMLPITFGYGLEPMGLVSPPAVRAPRYGGALLPHPFS